MQKIKIFREAFKLSGLRESFKFALRGIVYLFIFHRNMRIIFLLGVLALLLGFHFQLRGIELMVLCLTVTLVFVAEVVNTTVELILDVFCERYHPKIKIIKDISAAVVFISILNSVVIGYIIFVRRLIYYFIK
ncbi:MAG: diacylglycerol kinase family protein [Candidatus Omnitrophica bacterium]|nr:diacylglycerol kinase family protein [Candidatus Omnitrophota bacterium]